MYDGIPAVSLRNFHALHFSGLIAAQSGRYEDAVSLIGRALQVDASDASAHLNMGSAPSVESRLRISPYSAQRAISRSYNASRSRVKRSLSNSALPALARFTSSRTCAIRSGVVASSRASA